MDIEIKNLSNVLQIDGNEELLLEYDNNNYRLKLKQLHKTNIDSIYPHIEGDMSSMEINSTRIFILTNPDDFSNYTLEAICGSVSKNDDEISYTAPSTPGICGFIINDRIIEIEVIETIISNCNTIVSSEPEYGNRFGWSVAISGDGTRIVVGENYNDTYYSGSAYVFKKSLDGWVEEVRLFSPGYEQYNDNYSVAVDINYDGTRIAVGASKERNHIDHHNAVGSVYIYLRTGTFWSLEQRIALDIIDKNIEFGCSIKFNKLGNKIVIGSKYYEFLQITNTGGTVDPLTPDPEAFYSAFIGDITLGACDDCYTDLINLAFPINFYGSNFNGVYVSNNGNVALLYPYFTWQNTQHLSELNIHIFAPFFGDIDTIGSGTVTYGNSIRNGKNIFVATWTDVGRYNSRIDKLNTFQMIIIDRSDVNPGDFDLEYNYKKIEWDTSDGYGGDPSAPAVVGLSNGSTFSYELPGSLINDAMINTGPNALVANHLTPPEYTPVNGRYIWQIRNGVVNPDGTPPSGGTVETNYVCGAAFVFDRVNTTWTEEVRLLPPVLDNYKEFGFSVTIDDIGETVAIGEPYKDHRTNYWNEYYQEDNHTNDYSFGYAYTYSKINSIWANTGTLIPSILNIGFNNSNRNFGHSLALSANGDILSIGAPGLTIFDGETTYIDCGGIYIWKYNPLSAEWYQSDLFLLPNKESYDYFGISVDINEGTNSNCLVIGGAYNASIYEIPGEGKAAIFRQIPSSDGTWELLHELQTSISDIYTDENNSDHFGRSVSIAYSSLAIAIGATNKIVNEQEGAGAVYPCLDPLISINANVDFIYNFPTGEIVDNSSTTFLLNVTDVFTIDKIEVILGITHTFLGDISVSLIHPDGTAITLFHRPGSPYTNAFGRACNLSADYPITIRDNGSDNSENIGTGCISDSSIVGLDCGIDMIYIPDEPLSTFSNKSATGEWSLIISDHNAQDIGSLHSCVIRFYTEAGGEEGGGGA